MREKLIQPILQTLRHSIKIAKKVTTKLQTIPTQQALQLHLKIQRPNKGSLSGRQIRSLTPFLKRKKRPRAIEDLQHNLQINENRKMISSVYF